MLRLLNIELSITLLLCILCVGEHKVVGQQNGELHSRGPGQQTNGAPSASQNEGATKIQYVNVNGLPVLVQFTYVGPPKILPIATADSYPEGSLINLICTVSGGQRNGLSLSWMINGEELNGETTKYSGATTDNISVTGDNGDISILKIMNATYENSGQYTCTAKNPLGQDSTSVKIVINGMI